MLGSDTSPGDIIGQDFGPYRIVRRLGMGGMAETFEAIRQGPSGFSRRVCLKLVRAALRHDEHSIKLFEREARLAAKLHHGNIVSVIDFGEIEDTLYMALELVDGVDLRTLLGSRRRLSHGHVVLLGHELGLALEHAHERPDEEAILHRDISPSNVLVSRNGEVRLTDFGLANVASGGTPLSTVKGKFPYMAPERLRDEPIDERSDLFSLGVILFEALAGRRPYDGGHDPATIMLIIEGDHPPLRELVPDAPETLCGIVESLINPDRDRRPPRAGTLVEQLEALVPPPGARRKLGKIVAVTPGYTVPVPLADESPPVNEGSGTSTGAARRWSRRDVGRLAAWATLLLGGAVLGVAAWPRTEATPEPRDTEDTSRALSTSTEATPVGTVGSAELGATEPVVDGGAATSNAAVPVPIAAPPAPARLTVLVSPWGNVWINGKPRGAAPLKNAPLKAGRYRIGAGQGEPTERRTVRLRAGQRKTIRFDLTN